MLYRIFGFVIKIIRVFAFCLFIISCTSFSYSNSVKEEYKDSDGNTVLYYDPDINFRIVVFHPRNFSIFLPEYFSHVIFYADNPGKQIIIEDIVLEHRHGKDLINPKTKGDPYIKFNMFDDNQRFSYTELYKGNFNNRMKYIEQKIYIKFTVDEEVIEIEKQFKLKRLKDVSLFDVLMSI